MWRERKITSYCPFSLPCFEKNWTLKNYCWGSHLSTERSYVSVSRSHCLRNMMVQIFFSWRQNVGTVQLFRKLKYCAPLWPTSWSNLLKVVLFPSAASTTHKHCHLPRATWQWWLEVVKKSSVGLVPTCYCRLFINTHKGNPAGTWINSSDYFQRSCSENSGVKGFVQKHSRFWEKGKIWA